MRAASKLLAAVLCLAVLASGAEPPVIPVGLDAYRLWERWPTSGSARAPICGALTTEPAEMNRPTPRTFCISWPTIITFRSTSRVPESFEANLVALRGVATKRVERSLRHLGTADNVKLILRQP